MYLCDILDKESAALFVQEILTKQTSHKLLYLRDNMSVYPALGDMTKSTCKRRKFFFKNDKILKL